MSRAAFDDVGQHGDRCVGPPESVHATRCQYGRQIFTTGVMSCIAEMSQGIRQVTLTVAAHAEVEVDGTPPWKPGLSLDERAFRTGMIARARAYESSHHVRIEMIRVLGDEAFGVGQSFIQVGGEHALYIAQ